MIHRHVFGAALLALANTLLLGTSAHAQTAPPAVTQGATNVKRTVLQKVDVPGSNSEAVTVLAEIVPSLLIGKHMHFGVEVGYVVAGDIVLLIDGKPEQALKVGDSYVVPANATHDAKSGPGGTKLLITYIVEKGKALATPVN